MLLHRLSRHGIRAAGAAVSVGTISMVLDDGDKKSRSEGLFRFPDSQLFKPVQPYPFWDYNWDFREETDETILSSVKRSGTNRHVILVRHGQYDETYDEDERRILTPLGRQQAEATGKRLAEILASAEKSAIRSASQGGGDGAPPQLVVRLHSSNMARAIETADLIAKHLPMGTPAPPQAATAISAVETSSPPTLVVERVPPNKLLNEGRPCHVVPEGRSPSSASAMTSSSKQCGCCSSSSSPSPSPLPAPHMSPRSVHRDGARIETAFRELFYRAPPPPLTPEEKAKVKAAKKAAKEAAAAAAAAAPAPAPAAPSGASPVPAPAAVVLGANATNLAAANSTAAAAAPGAVSASSSSPSGDATSSKKHPHARHEYDVVVCHGNVIRYFAMRALQLPPEAWLRLCTFNCSLTYLVIRPTGGVSLRTLGDVGHLSMEETTFSGHHGFEW